MPSSSSAVYSVTASAPPPTSSPRSIGYAFVQALRDHHGALYAESELARRVLLQFAGRERSSCIAAPLLLFYGADQPIRGFEGGANLACFFLVRNFDLLFAFADEAGIEGRRLGSGKIGVNGPIFFFVECLDFTLTLDDQPEGDRLYATGGKTAAH